MALSAISEHVSQVVPTIDLFSDIEPTSPGV
jgi:hypothetical protein